MVAFRPLQTGRDGIDGNDLTGAHEAQHMRENKPLGTLADYRACFIDRRVLGASKRAQHGRERLRNDQGTNIGSVMRQQRDRRGAADKVLGESEIPFRLGKHERTLFPAGMM